MVGNEAKKYSPNARKFEAKADKQIDEHDVIVTVQVMNARLQVMHVASLNLQT